MQRSQGTSTPDGAPPVVKLWEWERDIAKRIGLIEMLDLRFDFRFWRGCQYDLHALVRQIREQVLSKHLPRHAGGISWSLMRYTPHASFNTVWVVLQL